MSIFVSVSTIVWHRNLALCRYCLADSVWLWNKFFAEQTF